MRKHLPKDTPSTRPKTLGEARALIADTFKLNRWSERDIKVFFVLLGIEYEKEISKANAKTILEEMEKARMILLEEA